MLKYETRNFGSSTLWKNKNILQIFPQTDNIGYLIELSQNVKISLQTFSDAFKNK